MGVFCKLLEFQEVEILEILMRIGKVLSESRSEHFELDYLLLNLHELENLLNASFFRVFQE